MVDRILRQGGYDGLNQLSMYWDYDMVEQAYPNVYYALEQEGLIPLSDEAKQAIITALVRYR